MSIESHSDILRSKINQATDCLSRAEDGMNSESWVYVQDQLCKAQKAVVEARFRADVLRLLWETPDKSKLANWVVRRAPL